MNNKLDRLYRRIVRQFRVKELLGFCQLKRNYETDGYTVKFNTPSINANPLLIGGGGFCGKNNGGD